MYAQNYCLCNRKPECQAQDRRSSAALLVSLLLSQQFLDLFEFGVDQPAQFDLRLRFGQIEGLLHVLHDSAQPLLVHAQIAQFGKDFLLGLDVQVVADVFHPLARAGFDLL